MVKSWSYWAARLTTQARSYLIRKRSTFKFSQNTLHYFLEIHVPFVAPVLFSDLIWPAIIFFSIADTDRCARFFELRTVL